MFPRRGGTRSSERKGGESFAESRGSLGAGDDADSLNNERNSRNFDSWQVEKGIEPVSPAALFLEPEVQL